MSDVDEKRTRQISLMVSLAQLEKFFCLPRPGQSRPRGWRRGGLKCRLPLADLTACLKAGAGPARATA